MGFNSILRHFNLLNIALLSAAVFLGSYILPPLFNADVKYNPPSPKKAEKSSSGEETGNTSPSPQEFSVVAERNLFHPSRSIPPVVVAEAPAPPPLPKPDFVLYGTMISGDDKLAFIEDKKAPGTAKKQRSLHLGSALSGFTLTEVYQDKVVMERGDEKLEVRILDSAKSRTVVGGPTSASRPASQPQDTRMRRPVLRNTKTN